MFSRTANLASLTIACCGVLFFWQPTWGQQDVCVVDMAQVFKNHNQFNRQLEILKQEAEAFKFELEQRMQQLQANSEKLKDFSPGAPEYKKIETELAQASANLEVDRRAKTREFVQREATLHFDTYVQVSQLIARYCEENGMRLALRYDSRQMNPEDATSIMQRVNGYVVFHRPQRDITQTIIQAANQANSATGARPPATQNR